MLTWRENQVASGPEERTGAFADALTGGLVACARRFEVALVGGGEACGAADERRGNENCLDSHGVYLVIGF